MKRRRQLDMIFPESNIFPEDTHLEQQILLEIGIPHDSPVMEFLPPFLRTRSIPYTFIMPERARRKAAKLVPELRRASWKPDYFLPLEYTKGFSNSHPKFLCSCLLGLCDHKNGDCVSDPEVAVRNV